MVQKKIAFVLGLILTFTSTTHAAPWTDPNISRGDSIKLEHITELRNATKIVEYNLNGTVSNGLKIRTNIPATNSSSMPTIFIEGYNYGQAKNIDLQLSFYPYSNSFINHSVSSSGGYNPVVKLSKESGKIVIFLEMAGVYYPRIQVKAFAKGFGGETQANLSGWTVVDQALSGSPVVTLPYRNNFMGRVGIGTESPAQSVHTTGNVRADGRYFYLGGAQYLYGDNSSALYYRSNHSTVTQKIFQDAQGTTYGRVYGDGNGANFGLLDGDGHWGIMMAKDNNIGFRVNNSEKMRILSNGNVGIGTTNPAARLQVSGGNSSVGLFGPNTSWGGYLKVGAGTDSRPSASYAQVISTNGNLHLDSGPSRATYVNYYSQTPTFINARGGNVGIGTTSPGAKLHVAGQIIASNPTASNHVTTKSYVDSAVANTPGDNLGNHNATNNITFNNFGLGVTGLYASTRYQNVFSMGAAYRPNAAGTSLANMYGIAWTHTNVGGQSKSGLGHQALIVSAGTTRTALGNGVWTAGTVTGDRFTDRNSSGYYLDPASVSRLNDIRPNIMYDGQNTGYYVDPASTSNLNTVRGTIFQDRNNTAYYADPASESRFNTLRLNGNLRRAGHNVGHQEGSYNNIGNNQNQSNPIYSIGSSYNPGTTTLSNFYGIGYTNASASFIGGSAGGWGLYVAADGDARTFLSGGTGNSYLNSNGGNVGIGTTSPAAKLHVAGQIIASNPTASNHVTTKSYVDSAVANTPGDNLGNHTATTTLNMANRNITGVNSLTINDIGDQEGIIFGGSAAKIFVSPFNSGNSDGYLRLINDGGIVFEPGGEDTERMTLASNGRVGIGTTAPSQLLHVNGTMTASRYNDNNSSAYYLDPSSVSYLNDIRPNILYDRNNTGYYLNPDSVSRLNDIRPNIMYDGQNTGYYVDPASTSRLATLDVDNIYSPNNTTYTYLSGGSSESAGANILMYGGSHPTTSARNDFHIRNNSTYRMTIDGATGNMGIGTTSPSQKLHVSGNIRATGHLYADGRVYIDNTTNYLSYPTGNYSSVQVNGSGKAGWEGYSINGLYNFMSSDSNNVGIYNDVDNRWIMYHTRNSSTNLYRPNSSTVALSIGSGSTSHTGDFYSDRFRDRNSSSYYLDPNSISYLNDIRPNIIYDRQNTSYYVDPASSTRLNQVQANSFNYTSDKRAKENIKPLSGLDTIEKLRGVSFDWKETGKPSIGLIAQEVETVYPELISEVFTKDASTGETIKQKSVAYGNLVAPLIEAVKEQQRQIEAQNESIERLEARIELLMTQ